MFCAGRAAVYSLSVLHALHAWLNAKHLDLLKPIQNQFKLELFQEKCCIALKYLPNTLVQLKFERLRKNMWIINVVGHSGHGLYLY